MHYLLHCLPNSAYDTTLAIETVKFLADKHEHCAYANSIAFILDHQRGTDVSRPPPPNANKKQVVKKEFATMKRLHIISKPTKLSDLQTMSMEDDAFTDDFELKAEKIEAKRLRRFRQQYA